MVKRVTQFPSDQEMTRFISTAVDKDLLKKCHHCMEVIRAAKDHQAAEANKNAANLLDELDMEKIREDLKRAAAARKREKKKRKKQEKKQEKRRAESDDLDNDSQVWPQCFWSQLFIFNSIRPFYYRTIFIGLLKN
jgi:ankyrin repeat domain-containing protein 17